MTCAFVTGIGQHGHGLQERPQHAQDILAGGGQRVHHRVQLAPLRRRLSPPNRTPEHDQRRQRPGHVSLNLTDAEWEAWSEGADVDDILAARPRRSLPARIAEFFKGEPEAGL